MQKKVYKNEVYYADLEPVIGSEQGGTRPVLILQNDIGNKHSPTTIVAAITTRTGKKVHQPTHVHIDCPGLARNSIVLLEQIRTIDKTRLRQKPSTTSATKSTARRRLPLPMPKPSSISTRLSGSSSASWSAFCSWVSCMRSSRATFRPASTPRSAISGITPHKKKWLRESDCFTLPA